MRNVVAFLLFVTAPVIGHAQEPRVDRIEILETGIYKTETTKVVSSPGTPTGNVHEVTNIRHVRTTTTIPAQIGTDFGFRYRIVGKPQGARVNLKFITLIPAPGIRNPTTGNTTVRGEYSRERTLGEETTRIYGFDYDWEIVPGSWTLEIWQGDRKLASRAFTVVKP